MGKEPSIPSRDDQTAPEHEHREIPQFIIAEASAGTENDQDARDLVTNSLLRELYRRDRDNSDRRSIEARQQGVDGLGKSPT